MSVDLDVKTLKLGFWHMPKTFYAVLLIEFWERFAFYGLQSVAVLYFVQRFNFTPSAADELFGSFSALVFGLLTIGGVIGDKLLGLRRAYVLGILFLILGYGVLSISPSVNGLYMGMGLVLVGNIFFKTNANNYVGRCFESNDPRLDSAFTYFYMSINVGSFSGLCLIPILAQHLHNYRAALILNAIGMVAALIFYFIFISRFKLADNQVGKSARNLWLRMLLVSIVAFFAAFGLAYLLQNLALCKIIFYCIATITLVLYLYVANKFNHYESKGLYIALILLLQSIVFFILYMQQAESLTLFANKNVDLNFWGYSVPAGLTQSFAGISLVILSPIMANIYFAKEKRDGKDFSIQGKYALGLIIAGLGFVLLAVGAQFFADPQSKISVIWLLGCYILSSVGELLVSALGPSMMVQLLPKRVGGFAQGIWYLSTAIGIKFGSQLAAFAANQQTANSSAGQSLHEYMTYFYQLGIGVVLIGIFLCCLIKPVMTIIHQVTDHRS